MILYKLIPKKKTKGNRCYATIINNSSSFASAVLLLYLQSPLSYQHQILTYYQKENV